MVNFDKIKGLGKPVVEGEDESADPARGEMDETVGDSVTGDTEDSPSLSFGKLRKIGVKTDDRVSRVDGAVKREDADGESLKNLLKDSGKASGKTGLSDSGEGVSGDSTFSNPMLDDEDEGDVFNGFEEEDDGEDGGDDFGLPVLNESFDGDSGEGSDGVAGEDSGGLSEVLKKVSGRGGAVVEVGVEEPVLDGDDRVNIDRRLGEDDEWFEGKLRREAESGAKKQKLDSGFDSDRVHVVDLRSDGRENIRARRKRGSKPVEDDSSGVSDSVVKVDGEVEWSARGGRVGDRGLEIFENLGLRGDRLVDKSILKDSFSRVDSDVDEAARERSEENIRRAFGSVSRGSTGSGFARKDREVLQFIAMFKYATARHLSNVLQCSVRTVENRLSKLKGMGLVVPKKIYGARPLWLLTEAGWICSGVDVGRITAGSISYGMIPHTFVVNHVASHLWGGGLNVLEEDEWPVRNRLSDNGKRVAGENLVSEYEVQSAFTGIRRNHTAETFRPIMVNDWDSQFDNWERAGGWKIGDSPELKLGNEHFWVLIPPNSLRLAYHVPDLIVKRERVLGNEPKSIAVEIELANKSIGAYDKAMSSYYFDSSIYDKVVWVVKSRGAARKLEKVAKDLGKDFFENRVRIVPIHTENGVFQGKEFWLI